MNCWKYYKNAAIPTFYPTQEPDLSAIENGSIWQTFNKPLWFARWTTDFDCDKETNWWYVIKDTPFDISALKSKRRYDINKGIKNFDVKEIDPLVNKEKLLEIQLDAFSSYPTKYRPTIDPEVFLNKTVLAWTEYVVLGAFFRETDELAGYALLTKADKNYVDFMVLRVMPKFEKFAINAAIVEGIMRHFHVFLAAGGVLCDGARSIFHETAFQEFLEKNFAFRKAYCNLHIAYNPKIKWVIKLIYPFRKLLYYLDSIGIVHKINSVLKMEEIVRECNE